MAYVIAGIIVGSRFILRPVFRAIAATGIRELFTATALFVVVGIATIMGMINIAALGTFIGGHSADGEYATNLKATNQGPFTGLFFSPSALASTLLYLPVSQLVS